MLRQFKIPPGVSQVQESQQGGMFMNLNAAPVEIKSVSLHRQKGPRAGYFAPPRMGLRPCAFNRVPDYTRPNEGRQRGLR